MSLTSIAPGPGSASSKRESQAHEAPGTMRAVIVEKNPVIREGLCGILAGSPVRVVGAAATADEALQQLRALAPDVVFLEAQVAEANGFALLEAVAGTSPQTAVIVLSMGNRGRLLEALQHGAACYLLQQGLSKQALLLAAEAAKQGFVLADGLALRRTLARCGLIGGAPDVDPPQMTARELEVLDLVQQGLSNRQIAEALTVSMGTVRSHVSSILRKLGVRGRLQAATLVTRWRLEPEESRAIPAGRR